MSPALIATIASSSLPESVLSQPVVGRDKVHALIISFLFILCQYVRATSDKSFHLNLSVSKTITICTNSNCQKQICWNKIIIEKKNAFAKLLFLIFLHSYKIIMHIRIIPKFNYDCYLLSTSLERLYSNKLNTKELITPFAKAYTTFR